MRELIDLGTEFDRVDDELARVREGGHSVARVVHAGGDATGAEIERSLVAAVQASGADVHESTFAIDLLVEGGRVRGVRVLDRGGTIVDLRATHVLVATGGAGQCFAVTTNPALSTGDGIAMAIRAGAAVADLEFMQFHPTALHDPVAMPRPLLSEALRGDGAIVRDEQGVAFMVDEHPLADLAPRDVVARAIGRRCNDRGLDHLWLDATAIDDFPRRFPTIWRSAQAVGLDPQRRLAARGARRALPLGRCVHRPRRRHHAGRALGVRRGRLLGRARRQPSRVELVARRAGVRGARGRGDRRGQGRRRRHRRDARHRSAASAGGAARAGRRPTGTPVRDTLQRLMTRDAGVLRSGESLTPRGRRARRRCTPPTSRTPTCSPSHACSSRRLGHGRSRAAPTPGSTSPSRRPRSSGGSS